MGIQQLTRLTSKRNTASTDLSARSLSSPQHSAKSSGSSFIAFKNLSWVSEEMTDDGDLLELSDEEWRAKLNSKEYRALRKKEMEGPWTGMLCGFDRASKKLGVFVCRGCDTPVYNSTDVIENTEGYLTLRKPINAAVTLQIVRNSPGLYRYCCAKCESFLGRKGKQGALIGSYSVYFEEMDRRSIRSINRAGAKSRGTTISLARSNS